MGKFKTYTIKPGKHYSNVFPLRRIIPHLTDRLDFIIKFDESIKYICKDPKKQSAWHKITGFKEITLKDNSARPGVRWNEEEQVLQFCLYVHYNGVNLGANDPPVIYSTRNVKEEIRGHLITQDDFYYLNINGKEGTEDRGGGWLGKFLCWPYVEGDFLNPKPITIQLKIL